MPGSGKTTLGAPLAQALSLEFVDTDQLLERQEQQPLQAILELHGALGLRQREGALAVSMPIDKRVIATGGSMVYSTAAMARLVTQCFCIYLQAELNTLGTRLTNLDQRGFASPGMSLKEVLAERAPLYERYSHARLAVDGLDTQQALQALIRISQQR